MTGGNLQKKRSDFKEFKKCLKYALDDEAILTIMLSKEHQKLFVKVVLKSASSRAKRWEVEVLIPPQTPSHLVREMRTTEVTKTLNYF